MDRFRPLPEDFYRRSAEEVAPDLLGRYLVRHLEMRGGARAVHPRVERETEERRPDSDRVEREPRRERLVVRVVEVEAYLGAHDRASHAWAGRRSARNASLYLPPGHAYVYLIYGLHHCLNAVTGDGGPDDGSAVLLRAGEVAGGEDLARRHRGLTRPPRHGDLAGGPGKLCQALAIDRALDGSLLTRASGSLYLAEGDAAEPEAVIRGPRVGVDYAGEAASWPLRFALRGHPEVSRPRP